MRIYSNPMEAFREVERDLWEMGINVHPQTMQDKAIGDDPDYMTKELQAYGFQIVGWDHNPEDEAVCVNYTFTGDFASGPNDKLSSVLQYIDLEFKDRTSNVAMNPGNSYAARKDVWNEFMHDGKFSYTYSERISPQLELIIKELRDKPETRQGIINIHSNIQPSEGLCPDCDVHHVLEGADLLNMGGQSRIPCSLHYQFMRRLGKLDMIYSMRSCDYLTHFAVDIMLAMRMQEHIANLLGDKIGRFTYFTGSLHAYAKDMKKRNIF